ncbi:MAG: terminase [Oceanospirillaceae bacterium]|nr:terminase [Oceanospirillaceae bacterium]
MSQSGELNLNLHEKQGEALNTPATELLYGGAAGGGKSHLMRIAAIIWCSMIPGLQVYIFRRIREDLVKNHIEGPKGFRAVLAPWVLSGFVSIVEDEIRFWNGSKIYLCHCKDEKDRFKYQGAEIHVLLMDELTHFTEVIYRFLRGRVRAVGLPELPEQYKGMFPRILCGSNPGNIGHHWVKSSFVDLCRDGKIQRMTDQEGGMLRQYIPAKLSDNPSMALDDPGYRARLRGLGSAALVRAMEDGDWDIIDGAFFDCWDTKKHVLQPFTIPKHWLKFRAFDWGSAKPFSVGWWAVAADSYQHGDRVIPRGALVRYREWYGCQEGKPNTGLKLTAEQVAMGICERETEEIDYSVADPAIFAEDGGPSIAERMGAKEIYWKPADNKRVAGSGHVGGWDQMRGRLVGEDEKPMIYCFSTCTHSIRTIPSLQHDPNKAEDLDTNSEDHAADEWRYACMSRPWLPTGESERKPRDRWDKAFGDDEDDDNWKTA